jgi:hypothetical protein
MPEDRNAGGSSVGFGKPPEVHQFKPGQSGNPKGRPKGSKNLKTDLIEELQEQILIREGATEKRVSKQRAIIKSLTAKSAKGDVRATSLMFNMMLRLLDVADDSDEALPLSPEERAVVETLQARVLRHLDRPEAAPDGQAYDVEGPT